MPEKNDSHRFAGCNRLLGQYQQIGKELIAVEARGSVATFREGVVDVPTEVLESYLEDLLDLGVKEDFLHIFRDRHWFHSLKVLALGIIGAVVGGLYSVSVGASVLSSFSLILILGLPFASILYFAPKIGLVRRMRFAKVVSAEISRRRGKDGTVRQPLLSSFSEVLNPTKASVPGAAKKIFH